MGKYLNSLVDFLAAEKPDFISMQEVSTNKFNQFGNNQISLFEYLKEELNLFGSYRGDTKLVGDVNSTFGNAVLCKWQIRRSSVLTLKKFRRVTLGEIHGEPGRHNGLVNKHLLDVEAETDGQLVHILSWHGAWTAPPHDTVETYRQAKLVHNYLKKLNSPFILGGDLNAVPGSRTVRLIEKTANNLMSSSKVEMTTNPKVHKIAPRGYLIDYIFASSEFKLLKLEVPQITVSDHLPVVAELEI